METLDKTMSTAVNISATSNFLDASSIKSEMDIPCSNNDRRHLSLRELNESDRTTMIQDTVEKAVR